MQTLSKPVQTIRKETPATQRILDLRGEWTLRQAGKKKTIKANVPGTVYTDLLATGIIPDPYYSDNEDPETAAVSQPYRYISIARAI